MPASEGPARPRAEARRVALVVVHGIGNQPAGSAGAKVAAALKDPGSPVTLRHLDADLPEAQEITVEGVEVAVCEAHWASASHPDNPPRVQNALGSVAEVVGTLKDAVAVAVRPDSKGGCGCLEMLYMVLCGLGACTTSMALALGGGENPEELGCLQGTAILALLALTLHAIWFVAVRRWQRGSGRGAARLQAWGRDAAAVVVRVVASIVAAGSISVLLLLCLLAVPFNLLGMAAAAVLRLLGALVGKLRLRTLSLWIYRLTWLFVVLPTHNCLQALRAFSLLISAALTERSIKVRLQAILWIPAILGTFKVLWWLTWRLLVPLVVVLFFAVFFGAGMTAMLTMETPEAGVGESAPALQGETNPEEAAAAGPAGETGEAVEPLVGVALVGLFLAIMAGMSFSTAAVDWIGTLDVIVAIPVIVAFLVAYALAIWKLLPVFDSVLDISNYHLASAKRRAAHFTQIELALSTLERAGYNEVHMVAHSLGTVLAYDYLKLETPPTGSIATLHTVGSPLNKFWFVDHEHWRRRESGLEGWVERGWTNYWALSDPVSGALRRFDSEGLVVSNRRLRKLGPPLISHIAYWRSEEFIRSLRGALRDPNSKGTN